MNSLHALTQTSGAIAPGRWHIARILGWMPVMLVVTVIELSLQSIIREKLTTNPTVIISAAFVTVALAYGTLYCWCARSRSISSTRRKLKGKRKYSHTT